MALECSNLTKCLWCDIIKERTLTKYYFSGGALMSIWIFVVLLFISAVLCYISIIVLDEDTEFGGCLFTIVVVAVFLISAVSTVGFFIGRQEVVTSEETEFPPPHQLVQLTTAKDAEYYLVQNGGKFQFSYIDEADGLVTREAEVENSKVYYGTKKDSDIRVVIHETVKTHHNQWLFIRDGDEEETLYEYDFYIPNRDNIANTYEK